MPPCDPWSSVLSLWSLKGSPQFPGCRKHADKIGVMNLTVFSGYSLSYLENITFNGQIFQWEMLNAAQD